MGSLPASPAGADIHFQGEDNNKYLDIWLECPVAV